MKRTSDDRGGTSNENGGASTWRLVMGVAVGALLGLVVVGAALGRNAGSNVNAANTRSTELRDAARESALAQAGVAKEAGSLAQYSALSDGEVSRDEYERALNSGFECFTSQGGEVTRKGSDWTGLTEDFVIQHGTGTLKDSETNSVAAYKKCYESHAMFVDIAYQISIDEERSRLEDSSDNCIALAARDRVGPEAGLAELDEMISILRVDDEVSGRCQAEALEGR